MQRVAPILLLAALVSGAHAADADPAALLAAAHAKHADLTTKGLESFTVRVSVRRADDENLVRYRDQLTFGYSFAAPDKETFDFAGTLESAQKPLRDTFSSLWRDLTGALWFREFESATDLEAAPAPPFDVVTGKSAATGAFRASIDTTSPRLAEAVLGDQLTIVWTCAPSEQGLRVRRRDVSSAGALLLFSIYEVPRDVRGFQLPTVVRMKANGKQTEFKLDYVSVNGAAASAAPVDPAAVKALADATEKGWREFDGDKKREHLRALAEMDHDLASATIAKLPLKDASAELRAEAAEALGVMKRANVVPALLTALGANEKDILVYLKVIEALGEIGDARAVEPLSKDWWNQRIPEYAGAAAKAKVRALGNIKDAASVDALLDTFTLVDGGGSRRGKGDDKSGELKPDIVEALTKLTRQNFLLDRKAWNEWWKKSRSSFRF